MSTRDTPGPTGHWPLWIFGVVLGLVGLALAAGGAWLIFLGGSWYYLPAGIGMLVCGNGRGALALRPRRSG